MTATQSNQATNKNNSNWKMRAALVILLIPTTLYIYDNAPWQIRNAFRPVTGTLSASTYYVCAVQNDTAEELLIQMTNINDRKWRIWSDREVNIKRRIGRTTETTFKLEPGEQGLAVLPSLAFGDLGVMLLCARSDWETPLGPRQRVALYLLPREALSTVHPKYGPPDGGYPVFPIKPEDMETLTLDSIKTVQTRRIQILTSTQGTDTPRPRGQEQ